MTAAEAQQLPVEQMFLEMRGMSELEQRANALSGILAGDRTFLSVMRHLMRNRPTDVSIVYLRGVDTASHKFWAAAHPGDVGFPVSQTESRVFGATVARYYEYADEMLGLLVDEFGDGTVIVCSDHGFDGPKPGQQPGGINDHGPIGILVMSGDAFRDGVRIGERSVRDVTPTILALCGLSVGDDMDGSAIEDAFETRANLRAHRVASRRRSATSAGEELSGPRGGRTDDEKAPCHCSFLCRGAGRDLVRAAIGRARREEDHAHRHRRHGVGHHGPAAGRGPASDLRQGHVRGHVG
jgi:hypothetical protein